MARRRKTRKSLPKKIAKTLDIPEDILFNTPRITMMANNELRLENYKSVLEYESDKITISTNDLIIELRGLSLDITIITDDEISICGTIFSIEFSKFRS